MKKRILILLFLPFLLAGCSKEPTWEPTIIKEVIDIESIEGEYRFLYLTDTHMIVTDESDTQQMIDNYIPRLAEFKNAEGLSSAAQFPFWMKYANKEEMDAVLFGGDIIDFPSIPNIEYFENQVSTLKVPYLYTLGNHDWTYPWDYMTESGKATYIPMLETFTTDNSAIHTMEFDEFIIVALDNSTTQFNPDCLEEFKDILKGNKPVIVMFHVPVLTQSVLARGKEIRGENKRIVLGGGNWGGIYPTELSQEIMNMLADPSNPIALVLAGHVHFYDKDYVEGSKTVFQIVGDAGYKGSAIDLTIK